jgi:hypothetical protein
MYSLDGLDPSIPYFHSTTCRCYKIDRTLQGASTAKAQFTAGSNMMKTTVLLLLSILQLVLRGKSLFVAEYNCSTDGIPAVAVVAGQGPNSPSVQFFLPLFDNCSVAEVRKPAQLAAGGWYLL